MSVNQITGADAITPTGNSVPVATTTRDSTGKNALDIKNLDYTHKFENNASGQPIYEGTAAPGTAVSAAGWQIKKFVYDANGAITDIQWGSGIDTFTLVWDSRAGYSYS